MKKTFLVIISTALIVSQSLFAISFQVKNQSGVPVTLQIFDSQNHSIYKKDMPAAHESSVINIPTNKLGKAKYTVGTTNYEFDMANVRVIDTPRKNYFNIQKDGRISLNFDGSLVVKDPITLGGQKPGAALLDYDKLKDSHVNSLVSPLLKNREGLARTDFSKLTKKNQEQIQSMSYAEIADMPTDFSEYHPSKSEKSVIATYILYDGTNTWDNTIGYLLLRVDFKKNSAYVKEFLIKKKYRAGGFGKKLFALALNDYYANINPKGKVDLIISGTLANQQMLSAFYSKFGFKTKDALKEDGIATMTLDPADYKSPL